MSERFPDLERIAPLQGILGYLNFAEGKPDPRFQKLLSDAYGYLVAQGAQNPWKVLEEALRAKLPALKSSGSGAFRDTRQAERVLDLAWGKLVPAYRQHHADLLFHLSDQELLQPFFLARVFEAVLAQGAPWEDERRIVAGALTLLNDFVGHRPIAILETRPKGEPYPHERVRPIPLFIPGAGVASGRYHDLVAGALEILATTEPAILAEAYLDPELIDELAVDPRAYDHGHPVNRRPNYVFGDWDPHHLDLQGRYRRYVARQVTLDALLERVEHAVESSRAEVIFEAAAVLAGTIVMATGLSGNSPTTHDSTTTLATLMPRIASCRDAFYTRLLDNMTGSHADRLRQEAKATRQPFGGARQHLNQYLARHRAAQLQQKHLALLFAALGYPETSQAEAARIPAVSLRLLSEILGTLKTGQVLAQRGKPAEAAALLPLAEELLRRGIDCGAFADPWNILGFQGLFPLFAAREDSLRDARIDELIGVVEEIFNLYARLLSEAASVGDRSLSAALLTNFRRLGNWWDQFASVEVADVRRVHGGESLASAEHVARALALWGERGEKTADLAFWREHLEGFQSPEAFALVIDALLEKDDYRAAMGLLMNWLGQAERVGLEDGEYSFHALALRWMLAYTTSPRSRGTGAAKAGAQPTTWPLVRKFFDYLEANADEYWQVPVLESSLSNGAPAEEEEESLYSAAYADVTYQDSADDDEEGPVAEGAPQEFELEQEAERISRRLAFLSTVARLWQLATRQMHSAAGLPAAVLRGREEALKGWLTTAHGRQQQLLALLDTLHEQQIPEPLGSYDSLVEYDRRRSIKEQLLYTAIGTCLDTALAIGTLEGALQQEGPGGARPEWEPGAIQLEQALLQGDADRCRALLPSFLEKFHQEPLVFTALADGGQPRHILRARIAQSIVRALVGALPRLGLLHETYHLLTTARAMELAQPVAGRSVSEFNHLFQTGFQGMVEAVVEAAAEQRSPSPRDQELVDLLEALTRPFLALWIEHSQGMRLAALESIAGEPDWQALRGFIERYGRDLFHAKFMTLANLRGILHRGIGSYLDYLRDNPDPLHPVRLIDDLDRGISRVEALRWLQLILEALVENYEEYKDYNTTTPQSDYGENLHLLLDFLRLKAAYERHSWRLRPLILAHEILARKNRADFAVSWEAAFRRLTQPLANQYLQKLAELEQTHGMRLRTVRDRLEEQFIQPLALDRLCALIAPAMTETHSGAPGRSLALLQKELESLTATPTGVGLDVPHWLRRLEMEVQQVLAAESNVALMAEEVLQVPRRTLSFELLRKELEKWQPPSPSGSGDSSAPGETSGGGE